MWHYRQTHKIQRGITAWRAKNTLCRLFLFSFAQTGSRATNNKKSTDKVNSKSSILAIKKIPVLLLLTSGLLRKSNLSYFGTVCGKFCASQEFNLYDFKILNYISVNCKIIWKRSESIFHWFHLKSKFLRNTEVRGYWGIFRPTT